VQSVITAAARRARNTDPPGKLIWVIPSHLAAAFAAANPTICDGHGPQAWSEVERQVAVVRSRTPDAEILVITWEHFVYERAWTSNLGLSRLKWFDLRNEERALRTPARPVDDLSSPQQTDAVPPSNAEIEEMVLAHLRSIGATSDSSAIYRSQLRPGLVRNNPTRAQYLAGPVAGLALKNAVDAAIAAGRLSQPPSPTGRERLWLTERRPEARVPVPDSRAEGVLTTTANADVQPTKEPVYVRSGEFRKRLTDLGIFCEKRERDIFFEALSRILEKSPEPISRLRRELPKVAEGIAKERGVPSTDYRRIVNVFLKLLLVSGVLLGPNGSVIKRNVSAEAAPVAKLDSSAGDKVEQYMLEQILRKSDVKDREHWQLALAIFRQFDQSVEIDGMLDRVATLIAALGQRFILTDDGTYEYTEGAGTNVVQLRA